MTYDPNRRDRPDILRKRDDSMSGALTGGIAIVLLLLFGIAIFTLSSGSRDIVATDKTRIERTTPPPSTTGQGSGQGSGQTGAQVMPDRGPYLPNPTPPANPSPGEGVAK